MASQPVIVAGARTAMRRFLGDFANVSAIDLAAGATVGAIERAEVEPNDIEHVVIGNAQQTSPDAVYGARHVALKAGIPETVPALTVNRLCGSGIESTLTIARMIGSGEISVGLAGGMENMSMAPHVLYGARAGFRMRGGELQDSLVAALTDSYCGCTMSATSDNLAREYAISRADQDAYALESQQRAAAAQTAGRLAEEIIPVSVPTRRGEQTIDTDDHLRPETTLESLAALASAFGATSDVTAGNASGIVDGGAALVIVSAEWARTRQIEAPARIVGWATVGVDPTRMGIGPAPAIRALLDRCGWNLDDLAAIEVNEAFAGQYLAVERELGLARERVNRNGGAIALGHPLGMTGTRITLALINELRRQGGGRGVASACIGGGQGIAIAIEVDE